ncbi:hypothetical protein SNEBB_007342 [Seison nebaliae]|nr:hypothetical protein SNEBB_007342 [Seison nebaliae]
MALQRLPPKFYVEIDKVILPSMVYFSDYKRDEEYVQKIAIKSTNTKLVRFSLDLPKSPYFNFSAKPKGALVIGKPLTVHVIFQPDSETDVYEESVDYYFNKKKVGSVFLCARQRTHHIKLSGNLLRFGMVQLFTKKTLKIQMWSTTNLPTKWEWDIKAPFHVKPQCGVCSKRRERVIFEISFLPEIGALHQGTAILRYGPPKLNLNCAVQLFGVGKFMNIMLKNPETKDLVFNPKDVPLINFGENLHQHKSYFRTIVIHNPFPVDQLFQLELRGSKNFFIRDGLDVEMTIPKKKLLKLRINFQTAVVNSMQIAYIYAKCPSLSSSLFVDQNYEIEWRTISQPLLKMTATTRYEPVTISTRKLNFGYIAKNEEKFLIIYLNNPSNREKHFEIPSDEYSIFRFEPSSGIVRPGFETVIKATFGNYENTGKFYGRIFITIEYQAPLYVDCLGVASCDVNIVHNHLTFSALDRYKKLQYMGLTLFSPIDIVTMVKNGQLIAEVDHTMKDAYVISFPNQQPVPYYDSKLDLAILDPLPNDISSEVQKMIGFAKSGESEEDNTNIAQVIQTFQCRNSVTLDSNLIDFSQLMATKLTNMTFASKTVLLTNHNSYAIRGCWHQKIRKEKSHGVFEIIPNTFHLSGGSSIEIQVKCSKLNKVGMFQSFFECYCTSVAMEQPLPANLKAEGNYTLLYHYLLQIQIPDMVNLKCIAHTYMSNDLTPEPSFSLSAKNVLNLPNIHGLGNLSTSHLKFLVEKFEEKEEILSLKNTRHLTAPVYKAMNDRYISSWLLFEYLLTQKNGNEDVIVDLQESTNDQLKVAVSTFETFSIHNESESVPLIFTIKVNNTNNNILLSCYPPSGIIHPSCTSVILVKKSLSLRKTIIQSFKLMHIKKKLGKFNPIIKEILAAVEYVDKLLDSSDDYYSSEESPSLTVHLNGKAHNIRNVGLPEYDPCLTHVRYAKPLIELENDGSAYVKATAIGTSSIKRFSAKSLLDGTILHFEWIIPVENTDELSVNPNKGQIQPREIKYFDFTYSPIKPKTCQIGVELVTWSTDGQIDARRYKTVLHLHTSVHQKIAAEDLLIRISPTMANTWKCHYFTIYNRNNTAVLFNLSSVLEKGDGRLEILDNEKQIFEAFTKKQIIVRAKAKMIGKCLWKFQYNLHNSISKDDVPYLSNFLCHVSLDGVCAELKLVDARLTAGSNLAIGREFLQSCFSFPQINKEISKNILQSTGDDVTICGNEMGIISGAGDTKEDLQFNFCAAPHKTIPTEIQIVIQNVGQLTSRWEFFFPRELVYSNETNISCFNEWQDPKSLTEAQVKLIGVLNRQLFTIDRRKGELIPGECHAIRLSYRHSIIGEHSLPVLFKAGNYRKPLLINFVGITTPKNSSCIHVPTTVVDFEPVSLGVIQPPIQLFPIYNFGDEVGIFYVDMEQLKRVNEQHYGHPLIRCLTPTAALEPNTAFPTQWQFWPIQNKIYEIPVTIIVKDSINEEKKTQRVLLRCKVLYDKNLSFGMSPPFQPSFACRTSLAVTSHKINQGTLDIEYNSHFLEDIVNFGPVQPWIRRRKIAFLYNANPKEFLRFKWHCDHETEQEMVGVTPLSGRIEPNGFRIIQITFLYDNPSEQCGFHTISLKCEVAYQTKQKMRISPDFVMMRKTRHFETIEPLDTYTKVHKNKQRAKIYQIGSNTVQVQEPIQKTFIPLNIIANAIEYSDDMPPPTSNFYIDSSFNKFYRNVPIFDRKQIPDYRSAILDFEDDRWRRATLRTSAEENVSIRDIISCSYAELILKEGQLKELEEDSILPTDLLVNYLLWDVLKSSNFISALKDLQHKKDIPNLTFHQMKQLVTAKKNANKKSKTSSDIESEQLEVVSEIDDAVTPSALGDYYQSSYHYDIPILSHDLGDADTDTVKSQKSTKESSIKQIELPTNGLIENLSFMTMVEDILNNTIVNILTEAAEGSFSLTQRPRFIAMPTNPKRSTTNSEKGK